MFTVHVYSEAQSSISAPIHTHDILLSEPEIHTFQTNRFLSAEWKNTQGIYTMDPKSEFHQMHHIYLPSQCKLLQEMQQTLSQTSLNL